MKSFELQDSLFLSLQGFAHCNNSITLVAQDKFLFRDTTNEPLALISGGGSGHEPAHAGFIGQGMLSGVVCGDIFASPSTLQILNGIKLVNDGAQEQKGVLLIVKNYTGDVLHFGLAAERARNIGIPCEVVIVGDDVAVGRTKGGMVGRRALAGTVLVHKITGAFAQLYGREYGLNGTAKAARIVNDNLLTIGTSLDHCKVPGRPFESHLTAEQMELGMGIHNEPGVQVLEPLPSVEDLITKHMLPKLLDTDDKDRSFVPFESNDEWVLLVNNLGGVSNFMMTAIAQYTLNSLGSNYKIKPVKTICGTLMTAFNGNGFSITLLNATRCTTQLQKEFSEINNVLDLINSSTDAPGWTNVSAQDAPSVNKDLLTTETKVEPVGQYDQETISQFIKNLHARIEKAEPHITQLDTKVGDGDCGYTLLQGATALKDQLPELLKHQSVSEMLQDVSHIVEQSMGGTSGGLYSILVSGFTQGLIDTMSQDSKAEISKDVVAECLTIALDTLYKYTKARIGSSTLVDALEPFIRTFQKTKDVKLATDAAEKGAESTGSVSASFGRASYVGDSSDVQDPGAVGFVEIVKAWLDCAKHS